MSKLFLCRIFWLFAYQHYHTIKQLIVFYILILQIGSKCNTAITYRLFSGYSIFNTLVDKECENIFFGNRKVRTHYQHYLSYIIHKRDNLNWCWRVHVQDGDFRRGHCVQTWCRRWCWVRIHFHRSFIDLSMSINHVSTAVSIGTIGTSIGNWRCIATIGRHPPDKRVDHLWLGLWLGCRGACHKGHNEGHQEEQAGYSHLGVDL